MKTGILTFHNSYNFGANLQTLATQQMLKECGIEPVVVNYIDEQKQQSQRRMVGSSQASEHEQFANRYYSLSRALSSPEQVEQYCEDELDSILVGSDAVFRLGTKYEPKRIIKKLLGRDQQFASFSWEDRLPPFFLPWPSSKIKKGTVAASSRGTNFYLLKWNLYSKLNSSLRAFDFVTVRDEWTAKMVRFLSRGAVNPDICPDPVFGLNTGFELPEDERIKEDLSDVILMSGNFDSRWLEEMVSTIHAAGYRAAMLPNTIDDFNNDIVDFNLSLPMSPLQWYSCLANCRGFIGMRFHAFVSCLANKTPVITVDVSKKVIGSKNASNPNYDLAKRIGITNRYFLQSMIEKCDANKIIDQLFDDRSQELADAYADQAPSILKEIVERVR